MRRFPQLAAYVATFGSMTAAAAVVIALIVLNAGGDDPQGDRGNGARVVIAAQDIPAGTEISEQMVNVIDVPQGQLVTGAFSDTQPLVGQVARISIASGEQITASKIGPSANRFEEAVIRVPPGLRAVSLSVDPLTIDGDPILPGDRVDILVEGDGQGSATTVIENVEVLAVGSSGSVFPPPVEERRSQVEESRSTVTVAVEPEHALMLAETLSNGGAIRLYRPA